jgi:hypothetical protein
MSVSVNIGVIPQHLSRHRILIFAEAEKAAEAQHGVGDVSAGLVDHDVIDRAYLLLISAIDGFSGFFIALGQVAGSGFGGQGILLLLVRSWRIALEEACELRISSFFFRSHPAVPGMAAGDHDPCPVRPRDNNARNGVRFD